MVSIDNEDNKPPSGFVKTGVPRGRSKSAKLSQDPQGNVYPADLEDAEARFQSGNNGSAPRMSHEC